VIVTSAVGDEGKTSLSCNLATSLARAGLKTLLVDGDLRSPDVHGVFDLPARPGLSEVLRGEADVVRVVHPAAVRNLWVITAGLCDDRALQALARDEMHAVIERLKREFDFVVFDAPPVLPIADAALLARHADAAVQSVLLGASTLPSSYAAHERLQGLGIRTLGVVVAGVRGPTYGGGYAYGRGRTGSSPRPGDGES
jgi:capsular exopolysaccharide synthesis family protein